MHLSQVMLLLPPQALHRPLLLSCHSLLMLLSFLGPPPRWGTPQTFPVAFGIYMLTSHIRSQAVTYIGRLADQLGQKPWPWRAGRARMRSRSSTALRKLFIASRTARLRDLVTPLKVSMRGDICHHMSYDCLCHMFISTCVQAC